MTEPGALTISEFVLVRLAEEAQALGDCVRAFTAPHAGHADYREEWKP